MNHSEYLEYHKAVVEKCFEITAAKNHDYTPDLDDAFGNFRYYKAVGVSEEQGIFARVIDKLCRASAVLSRPQKVSENVLETLEDVVNYIILAILIIAEKTGQLARYRGIEMAEYKEPETYDHDFSFFRNTDSMEDVFRCTKCGFETVLGTMDSLPSPAELREKRKGCLISE